MSNLLIITDVARLRKIFGRLTEDKNVRLRIVNNLEKGGEEVAIEKPDVVFVQTHLSGLSAEILLMHLKKQLGRKRCRFVLLASPTQVSEAILKPYQGWLDTSADDGALLAALQQLLVTLLTKTKKNETAALPAGIITPSVNPQPVSHAESSALLGILSPPASTPPEEPVAPTALLPATTPPEATLEEQGITYAPRQRLQVYSEFTSSFDSAVSSAPEPESLTQAAPAETIRPWESEAITPVAVKPSGSKRVVFLLWLIPVIIVVVIVTYFQQKSSSTTGTVNEKTAPKPTPVVAAPAVKPPTPPVPAVTPAPVTEPPTPKVGATTPVQKPVAPQERSADKDVLTAISENSPAKPAPATAPVKPPRAALPDFIPRYGYDKQYSVANPGWERYKGQVTEFKILRDAGKIKVIQVIDRGGNGVPESFMKAVLRQVVKKPVSTVDASEKKDGYEIQRGRVNDSVSAVYYRDETGGRLRAFVLTWR